MESRAALEPGRGRSQIPQVSCKRAACYAFNDRKQACNGELTLGLAQRNESHPRGHQVRSYSLQIGIERGFQRYAVNGAGAGKTGTRLPADRPR